MRAPRLSILALAALGLAVPSAHAAGWTAPVTVSAAHTFVGSVRLIPGEGATTTVWSWGDGVGAKARRGAAFAALASGGAGIGAEQPLGAPGDLLDVQGYHDAGLVALSSTFVAPAGGNGAVRYRVAVTDDTATGENGRAHTIALTSVYGLPQMSIARTGPGIVAYAEFQPRTKRRIVRASLRSQTLRWSAPAVISGRGQADTSLATGVNQRGDAVVAFVRNTRVLARVYRVGHGWGALQTLAAPHGPTKWTVRAAVTDSGRVQVLWRRRQNRRDDHPPARALETAYVPAGGARFRAAQTVEPDDASTPSALVAVPGGFAVGYTVTPLGTGARPTPRARVLTPAPGPALSLSAPTGGARDVRLAFSVRGGLFAAWVVPTADGNGDGVGLGALMLPGDATFGPPEAITPAENVHEVAPGFTPGAGGIPLAAWSARPSGTGPGIPLASVRTVVRIATRTS